MSDKVDDLTSRLAALETKTDENGKTIWRVFEAVYGNGKPGLIADVQAIRQALESGRHHGQVWQWVVTTLIAAVAIVAAWLK